MDDKTTDKKIKVVSFCLLIIVIVIILGALFEREARGQGVEIRAPGLKNKCLDVSGASSEDGAKVQLWTCNGTPAQRFELKAVTTTPPPVNPPAPPPPAPTGGKEIAVYFQSWSAPWQSDPAKHELANLPPYVTTVLLAFVRPESNWTVGSGFWSAGLDFSSDAQVIRDAVAIAQRQGKKILLSVGGATYQNWSQYNVQGIVTLANYLGVSGIDLDYEDMSQVCAWSTGGTGCPKDQEFIDIIKKTRAAWPRPKLLTTAAWSTGAYGEGVYHQSKMDGRQIGSNFGMYVNPLKQVGTLFDTVYIMAYDAGNKTTTGYDWRQAYAAYRALYAGRLVIGVESAPEAWGGNVSDAADAAARAQMSNGVMLWSWQKPGGKALAQAACRAIGLAECDK